jgi:hypothetical protein
MVKGILILSKCTVKQYKKNMERVFKRSGTKIMGRKTSE